MMPPTFSILMAVYNHEAYVEAAVRSVLAQTVGDWELIVVNDGSRDGSGDILNRLAREDGRVKVHHQENTGQAGARNAGAAQARGAWLAYLDSDDLWFPDALSHFQNYLSRHPQARFLHGYGHRLRGTTITHLPGEFQEKPTGTRELFRRMFLNPMCVCHHRDLWEMTGGFRTDLRYCEDYDLFLRMSLHAKLEPINQPIGLRRRHGRNTSQKSGNNQRVEAQVLRRFARQYGQQSGLDQDLVDRRLGMLYERAAREYYREGDFTQSLAMVREARAHRPSWRCRVLGWLGWLRQPLGRLAG